MCWCPLGRNAAPIVVVFSGSGESLRHSAKGLTLLTAVGDCCFSCVTDCVNGV